MTTRTDRKPAVALLATSRTQDTRELQQTFWTY
jgi:hypothetical protein